jgi:predicted metal-dependent phosphoesterase TrpH
MEFRIDLHVHSIHSGDGLMRVDEILELTRRKGLGGVSICDHNTLSGTVEALEKAPGDLVVVPGAEYSTDRGHMLAYFITRDAASALPMHADGMYDFSELAAFVHSQGGLLFAAHPYRRPYARLDGVLSLLDGIEVLNARNVFRNGGANLKAVELCVKERLGFSAGSDAHARCELGNAYRVFASETPPGPTDIKAMLQSPSGICFNRTSPLSAQMWSAFNKHKRQKDYKKASKYILKTGFGILYDAYFRLNPKNTQETRGRIYRMVIHKEESN